MAEDTKDQAHADQSLITSAQSEDNAAAPQTSEPAAKPVQVDASNRTKTFLTLVGIVFALGFLMYGAYVAGQRSVDKQEVRSFTMRSTGSDVQLSPDQIGNSSGSDDYNMGPRGMMRGGWDDDTSQSSNSTRVSGVVTALSGDTITVAGGGTTTKVTVTSSTNYSGSSEPAKVNDTIVAFGTQNSDGSITATSIRLSRN